MRALLAALILCAGITVAGAYAPTAKERADCEPDARRLCPGAIMNIFSDKSVYDRVYDCMKLHRRELSRECDAVWRAHGQ